MTNNEKGRLWDQSMRKGEVPESMSPTEGTMYFAEGYEMESSDGYWLPFWTYSGGRWKEMARRKEGTVSFTENDVILKL